MPGINANKYNLVLGPAEVSLFLTFRPKVPPTISSKTSGYYVPLGNVKAHNGRKGVETGYLASVT